MVRSAVGTLTRAFRNAAGDAAISYVGQRTSGFMGTGVGGVPSNTAALLSATKISPTVYAIVRKASNAPAQVEWKLYKKNKTQQVNYDDDSNRTEVFSHLALDVLERPNDFMTRQELFETCGQHEEIVGESWIVYGNNGQPNGRGGYVPSSMWPVRPDKMKPVTSPTKFIAGYVYSGPDGEQVPLDVSQVMMTRVPDPEDMYRGLGWVRSILSTIDAEKYSAEWNRNFFINSAEPGGVIQFGDGSNRIHLTDPEFDEFQARWRETHRGVSNAHRVALLDNGANWVANSITHRDMQFAELRTVSRDTCLEAAAMPGSMIGISEHVNKANAQTGEVTFSRWIVKERLERRKQALNNDFLPRFGKTADGYEFDYMDPTPTDDAAETSASLVRAQSVAVLVPLGFDAAETLEVFGLPPIGWTKPEAPPAPIHVLPGGPVPPGNDPAKPEGQPNENADSEEMANA